MVCCSSTRRAVFHDEDVEEEAAAVVGGGGGSASVMVKEVSSKQIFRGIPGMQRKGWSSFKGAIKRASQGVSCRNVPN